MSRDADITVCETVKHGNWLLVEIDERSEVHVIPANDLIRHQVDEDCTCGPAVEAIAGDSGSMGFMYSHASLDGRELRE